MKINLSPQKASPGQLVEIACVPDKTDPVHVGQIYVVHRAVGQGLDESTVRHWAWKRPNTNDVFEAPEAGDYVVTVALLDAGQRTALQRLIDGNSGEPPIDEVAKYVAAALGRFSVEWHVPSVMATPTSSTSLASSPPRASSATTLWAVIRNASFRLRFLRFLDEDVNDALCGGDAAAFGRLETNTLRESALRFVQLSAIPERWNRAPFDLVESNFSPRATQIKVKYLDMVRPNAEGLSPCPDGFPLAGVPFLELIWSYWMEEGMLVQTMNHLLARFQNRRLGRTVDPLGRFDLNPLLPLRNLLWGFADSELRRLTVRRRAAEYQYEYGLQLVGRAVPRPGAYVESRTQFLQAFHTLLHVTTAFYRQRDDKTVDADAFPVRNALRDTHLVLAQGAHNQFADLPITARAEMLEMQAILAQREMREFLGGRPMVPYEEPWMDRVETMKTLQGWSDSSITQYYDLAVHGEMLVLSVRLGPWNATDTVADDAYAWADEWRDSVQRYVHAYRAVTGVDLAERIDATMPSRLMADRLADTRRRA
ncbi:MAG: hypothetical protein AB7W59_18605 [Acidimicrobiia bacterium]